MRILLLSDHFGSDLSDETLASDLAHELSRRGHDVVVYAQDWLRTRTRDNVARIGRITVYWKVAEGSYDSWFDMVKKWGLTPWRGWRLFRKDLLEFDPDVVIASQALCSYSVVAFRMVSSRRRSMMIQWDFFPYYQAQIGKLNSRFAIGCLGSLEKFLLNRFDIVAHMTSAGTRYFKENYASCKNVRPIVLPLWGPEALDEPELLDEKKRYALRDLTNLPRDKVIAIFGGQLSRGRGIESLLDLIRWAKHEVPDVQFIIVGDGELKEMISRVQSEWKLDNLELLGRVRREDYFRMLWASDIGILNTDETQNAPTFPSKAIDYLRFRLPILGSLEAATDARDIITREAGAGLISVAGDAAGLQINLRKLASDRGLRDHLGGQGYRYFQAHMTVAAAASRIETELGLKS